MADGERARHGLRHHRHLPVSGPRLQHRADRLRRGLPADGPGRGNRPDGGQDRHAGQVPNPPGRRRPAGLSGLRACRRGCAMSQLKRGGAAIVGAAESDLGQVGPGFNVIDLMAQGITRTLDDCGFGLKDVDGLICARTQARTSALNLSEYLGLPPAYVDSTIIGGAIVLTTPERAKSLKKPPVYVLGQGQAITHANISSMPDLTVTGALESGRQAYAMAGLGPKDIDVLELYDAFTINTILFLEDLGLCPKGEGGRFVEGGRIAPGGELPVNTNGGGLSYCHPGMYGLFLLIEAVRQLRGECGERQVEAAETAIAHGNGGVLSSQSTVILGTAATL